MAVDFNTLAARAEKRIEKRGGANKVFVMKVEGEPDIVIPKPDALVAMQSEEASTIKAQLQVLSGKSFGRILDLVKGKDISVVQDIITAMWDAWDDDSSEVGGGKGD